MAKPVTINVSNLFTLSTGLKVGAAVLLACAVLTGFGTVPKMASASGATPNELINTLGPAALAGVTWFVSTFFKSKQPLVAAVTAVIANPTDPVSDFNLLVQVSAYLHTEWPNEPAFLADIDSALQKLSGAVASDVKATQNAAKAA